MPFLLYLVDSSRKTLRLSPLIFCRVQAESPNGYFKMRLSNNRHVWGQGLRRLHRPQAFGLISYNHPLDHFIINSQLCFSVSAHFIMYQFP